MLDFVRNIGPVELIVVGAILFLFFGTKKMKEVAKNAGQATRELKNVKREYSAVNEQLIGKSVEKTETKETSSKVKNKGKEVGK